MRRLLVVATLLLLVSSLGFADLGRKHAAKARTSDSDINQAKGPVADPGNAPRVSDLYSPDVFLFADDFDGPNDTLSLQARGYKTYFRGSGPVGSLPTWIQGVPTNWVAYNGPTNGYVASHYNSVTGANRIDNWLVLPRVNINAGDPLKFFERGPTANAYPDSIKVMYSAVGDSVPEAGSWVELGYFRTTETGSWLQRTFNAPTGGTAARFAIRHYVIDGGPTGTNSNVIGIDALTVGPPPAEDIQVASALLSPTSPNVGQAVTISAIVNNVGTGSNPTSLPLTYKIGAVPASSGDGTAQTFTPTWTGSTATVSFTTTYTPALAGALTIGVRSFYVSDLNAANDSAKTTVTVYSAGTVLVGDFTTTTGWTRTGPDTIWFVGTPIQINGSVGGAALADFYNNSSLAIDTLISPSVDISTAGGKLLKFDHAYRSYTTEADSVFVLVSSNGGASWTELSRDGYPNMATLPSSTSSFTPSSATDWRNNSFIIPPGLPSATTKFAFVGKSGFGNNFWLDNVRVEPQSTMAYNSSTTTQNTIPLLPGTTNQVVIGVQVVTSGSASPLAVTRFKLNANGTTNVSDIANAKIFYTGTSNVFAAVNQFGSTVASPTIAPYGVNGSQALVEGTNYFWLAYDIAPGGTPNNLVDAECDSVTVGGTNRRPTVSAPSGARTIKVALAAGDYTVGLALFNRVLGKELNYERTTRRVLTEIQVPADNLIGSDKKGLAEQMTARAFAVPTRTQWVEVEEAVWTLMDQGTPYTGRPYIAVSASDRTKYGLGDNVLGIYTTITAALADLNTLGVAGSVRFLLVDASYPSETYPLTINVTTNVPTATNTVTIKPQTGVTPTVSGAPASGPVFKIINTNYVTLDGSNTVGGTTRNWTISNTGTTSPNVIHVGSLGTTPITNTTIKNCILINGAITSSAVVVGSGTAVGDSGYFNTFTLQNNDIRKAFIGAYINGGTSPAKGIAPVLVSNLLNSSGADAIGRIGLYVQGVDGANIAQNRIGNFDGVGSEDDRGIWIAQGSINSTAQRNEVYNLNYTGTGGYGAQGVAVSSATASCNNTVKNNFVYNLSGDGWNYTSILADNPIGIFAFGSQTGVNIYDNSINLYGNTLNTTNALSIGIGVGTGTVVDVRNNAIVNNLGLSAATGYGSAGVFAQTANTQFSSLNYNAYYVNPTGSGVKAIGKVAGDSALTLPAWQTLSAQEANGVTGDPLFTGNTNLHITNGSSPASNAGTAIAGVTDDFDGDVRNATTPDIGADEFSISSTVSRNVAIALGWNLISNPMTNPIPGDSVRQLYPTSLNAYAFEFLAGYVQRFRLVNGKGYWEKFPAAISQSVTGTERTRDSISVVAGWNIVGTISNTVDTSTIVSVPPGLRASQWFGYAAGYTPVTQLVPGKGYWLKSSAAGKFVLANPVSGPAKVQASGESALDALNTLTITDSRGGSQTLYFGADAKNEIQLPMFVMPPAPPAGALDARFETAEGGSMVQTHVAKVSEPVEFSVAVQSDAYPLTVSWKVNGVASYELTTAAGSVQTMRGEGRMTISNSEVSRLFLKLTGDGQLPADFALSQNYPNPFNPTTSIKYALPVDSKLTMEIYNVLGQRVRTLVNDNIPAGYHAAEWDGTGTAGQQLASGVYFLQLSAQGTNGKAFNEIRKLMMLK